MMEFANKVAWITGASSGIGEQMARSLHCRGAKVILSARRASKLASIKADLGEGAAILPLDISQLDCIADVHNEAIGFYGPIDMLINNAGISQRGLVEETDLAVDQHLMQVNYFGNIALTKTVLPTMLKRRAGNIAVISSIVGKLSTPFRSSYSASKHALHGFYDALRAEVSDRNVQIHMICPGYINTEISIHALNAKGQKHGKMDPNQLTGMSAELCAEKIVTAISRGKKEIYIGTKESTFVHIRRLFPSIYYKMIAKMAKEKKF